MVVSAHRLASEAGVDIMKKGGNAVDAAVATGFALAVVYPAAGNIGGGGFMTAVVDGEKFTLDFREKAPSGSEKNMYLDESGNVISGLSLYSHLASGVPGTVHGLVKVWQDYGSGNLSLWNIMKPAIRLAERGFRLSNGLTRGLNYRRDFFKRDDDSNKIFSRKDGRDWVAGDILKQQELAKTLKRIARTEGEDFYFGQTARFIVREMESFNGLITMEDLANYESIYRDPVNGEFLEYEIMSMGPPSSGGLILIHMLNMLEHSGLDSIDWHSSDYIHLLTEVERRGYADRAEHLGDMDYWDVPFKMFLSDAYASERIQSFDKSNATSSTEVSYGDPYPYESRETTHYSVVDKDGNAVSVTTTLNTGYGSGYVVGGAGFLLNNEMDDFSAKPGVPNAYGLVGNEANAIEPGKRPLSSMTPTIVLKDGKPILIIGSPGGSTIITTVMQVILNVLIYDMSIQQAVAASRFHSQWLPDAIFVEPFTVVSDVKENLLHKGHSIQNYRWGYIGQANGITITKTGFYGGADPRGENAVVGY
ncbi:MAG: gamma-glutamyltransferase [Candidatus Marinimicrobia bacterium]|nr:gamma-glutamyltransferase [Candidatus Neomarinimicrobiota bacterium]